MLEPPLRNLLDAEVDDSRAERLTRAILDGARPRPSRARRTGLGLAFAAGLLALLLWPREPEPALTLAKLPSALLAPPSSSLLFTLSDGSWLELAPSAWLKVHEASADRVELELVRGQARVDVAPRRDRRFAVRVGAETVEVLGTRFVVGLEVGGGWVKVEEGTVQVVGAHGQVPVSAGSSRRMAAPDPVESEPPPESAPETPAAPPRGSKPAPLRPSSRARRPSPGARARPAPSLERAPPPGAAASRAATSAAAEPSPEAPTDAAKPPPAAPDWREAAERGAHRLAYQRLTPAGLRRLSTQADAETLFLAADVARGAGDARMATEILMALLRRFPNAPSAPLAAITRARVLLETLDRPREAALAYEQAVQLGLPEPHAESARAGRVQAWARVGDAERARRAAQDYHRIYPEGRWKTLVDAWLR